jgi:hypothetical protein
MVAEGLDQIVGELAIALPSIAQQVQMGLPRLQSAQIVDRIVVGEAGVIRRRAGITGSDLGRLG